MYYQYQYYPGGAYNYGQKSYAPKDPFINREARHLTKLSLLAGAGVLGFVLIQAGFVVFLRMINAPELFQSNMLFQSVCGVMLSVAGVYLPFRIISFFYSEKDKAQCFAFGKPISARAFWLAAAAGLMICSAADYISAGFAGFASDFGVTLDYDAPTPHTAGEIILSFFEVAVVPAMVEEFAIRGVVMQPLRKFGDRFAIVMSALIFALMHGNMLQIPFAFIAGIALGYFAITTGSIWTSVAIHFANNLFSLLLSLANQNPAVGNFLYAYTMLVIFAVGAYCLLQYVKTPHIGLGFTSAPKNKKRNLWIAAGVFFAVSFLYAFFSVGRGVYLLSGAALVYFYSRYKKANDARLGVTGTSSLPEKLRVCLFCGTPTVIVGAYFLINMTMNTVQTSGSGGSLFFFGSMAAALAAALYAATTVKKSGYLENTQVYTVSYVLIGVIALLSAVGSFASGLVR